MQNILCFGDSNTYGWRPDGKGQYNENERWTGKLRTLLGDDYNIIEDGLCGRTTIFDDPYEPGMIVGIDKLPDSLEAAQPQLVILMLGTNDCRHYYDPTPEKIADGIRQLGKVILGFRNANGTSPKLLIVSPILIGAEARFHEKSYAMISAEVSRGLGAEFKKVAEALDCGFIDAAEIASPGPDFQHLTEEGHGKLAKSFFEYITK